MAHTRVCQWLSSHTTAIPYPPLFPDDCKTPFQDQSSHDDQEAMDVSLRVLQGVEGVSEV